jgi:molybdopterin/thiamine biosynthesis adenylyltransferase/rhodanese-related sulfurtransferase
MSEFERYSRQTLVKQVGLAGQEKLATAKVLIIGAGGLGCQVAAQLAGAGVGNLFIIDHDTVALSNLHRQILFREADIGKDKATVAKRELQAINSSISISALPARLSVSNVNDLIHGVDLVIDAADNFATSYLLSDACLTQRIALLSASVNRSFGYLGVFCGTAQKSAPSLRALFPKLPNEQLSCDTVGVTGPSVGVIASLQAQEAIKVLIGDAHQLFGKLLYVDLWNYNFHCIDFNGANEPTTAQIEMVGADKLLASDLVVDVRNPEELAAEPQPFRVDLTIPLSELAARLAEIPESARIVCVCKSGQRALIAAQQLLHSGHLSVAALLPND